MRAGLDIVVIGLSLSSSWGNGHATTFRALIKGLHAEGHRVRFLERDVPWYAQHRDLASPDFCSLTLYDSVGALASGPLAAAIARADIVMIGSYVPDGIAVIDAVAALRPRVFLFYDIDTPVTLAGLARGEETFVARRQVPLFDAYLSFTGGPTLTRLKREFGARRADAFYCSVDETLYTPQLTEPVWDLGYLGTYSPDRQPTLERLLVDTARRLPDRRFVVAGPQYPTQIAWPANVERIEHLPPSEHAAFYSRQRFTLNVTRADMIAAGHSPSVRLFEAAACGTPIVSDDFPGLEDLLPGGKALVPARTTQDVMAALALPEARRRAIAEAARAIVTGAHTGRARARQLAAIVGDIAAGAANRPQETSISQEFA